VADAPAFDWICTQLEERTSLDRLEARGTVRLTLKQAGLEASSVRPEQMKVVAEKVLAGELVSRGIEAAEQICSELAAGVATVQQSEGASDSPDEVFKRLGGN
jgi:hypothetical protein